eukprot:CAMPEP_0171325540 /NCGR_PEP_ID=MMETSP0816-20121228/116870_1 /TAXON_ID=420281 /ORGANISM="Proboscia inermis, Strain CCAP1064/1" /LENGTH=227 /DNA_ID=CAMNT_0011824737 /DNA_START=93 /DNA_END=777 /DNA_ORIENTATION=-
MAHDAVQQLAYSDATITGNSTNARVLEELCSVTPRVEIITESDSASTSIGNGCGILIVAKTSTGCLFGASALGKPTTRKNPSAVLPGPVAREATTELLQTLRQGGCMDDWLQDQIILYMALAHGTSSILTGALTLHTRTAIWIATSMTGAQFCVELQLLDGDGDGDGDILLEQQPLNGDGDGDGGSGSARADEKPPADHLDPSSYGQDGYVCGRHLITCRGISHVAH